MTLALWINLIIYFFINKYISFFVQCCKEDLEQTCTTQWKQAITTWTALNDTTCWESREWVTCTERPLSVAAVLIPKCHSYVHPYTPKLCSSQATPITWWWDTGPREWAPTQCQWVPLRALLYTAAWTVWEHIYRTFMQGRCHDSGPTWHQTKKY